MKNIGVVIYQKGQQPGTLNAKWSHSDLGKGIGIATGTTTNGFEGTYKIRYFNDVGEMVAERELTIEQEEGNYKLQWMHDGKITSVGIGLLVDDTLSAGWCNV